MPSLRSLNRKTAYAAAVFLLFLFYLIWPVNFYLAETLKTTYYMMGVPVLVAGVLYFRRLDDGTEVRLMAVYWLWFFLSRLFHDNLALKYDFQLLFDLGLMFPFFCLGFALRPKDRRRFLNWLSAAVGGFLFVLGIIALLAYVQRRIFINPITEGSLGIRDYNGWQRINILDTHPNTTSYWFMCSFFLMVYQFFACRRKLWRIPIVLAVLVDILVISITFTRGVMLPISVTMGLLAVLLLHRTLRTPRLALRIPVLLLSFVVTLFCFYKLFDLSATGLSYLSYSIYPKAPVAAAAEKGSLSHEGSIPAAQAVLLSRESTAPAAETAVPLSDSVSSAVEKAADPRSWIGSPDKVSSLRFTIWRSAFLAIKEDPSVLWKGSLMKDLMVISNTFTPHAPPHYHNVLFEVLMSSGIPGLLIIFALLILTVVKTVKLFFSTNPRATLAVKTLTLPVTAVLIYSMTEAMLFTYSDIRPLFYYLMSGMMLSYYYDIYPQK